MSESGWESSGEDFGQEKAVEYSKELKEATANKLKEIQAELGTLSGAIEILKSDFEARGGFADSSNLSLGVMLATKLSEYFKFVRTLIVKADNFQIQVEQVEGLKELNTNLTNLYFQLLTLDSEQRLRSGLEKIHTKDLFAELVEKFSPQSEFKASNTIDDVVDEDVADSSSAPNLEQVNPAAYTTEGIEDFRNYLIDSLDAENKSLSEQLQSSFDREDREFISNIDTELSWDAFKQEVLPGYINTLNWFLNFFDKLSKTLERGSALRSQVENLVVLMTEMLRLLVKTQAQIGDKFGVDLLTIVSKFESSLQSLAFLDEHFHGTSLTIRSLERETANFKERIRYLV